jgi:hypothetical protein
MTGSADHALAELEAFVLALESGEEIDRFVSPELLAASTDVIRRREECPDAPLASAAELATWIVTSSLGEPMTANQPQPPPSKSDSPAIWPLVIADLCADFSGIEQLIADALDRDAFGSRKYGTRLQAFNGRDPLVDAYQEALDLTVYLRQAIEEGDEDLRGDYNLALRLAVNLHRRLVER